jgi:ABC-2 type transport system permease protein
MESSVSELRLRTERPPVGAFWRLLTSEAKLVWRVPASLVFGLAIPLAMLAIFAAIPSFRHPNAALGGLTYLDVYLPILIVFVIGALGLIGVSPLLAGYREQGVLRRLSTTPVSPSWLLGAQLVINLGIAVVAVAFLFGASVAFLGFSLPAQLGGFALSLALTAAALFAIGLWVAAIARSAQVAGVLSSLLFYAMMFFAGLWLPQERMPAVLHAIADYTPLGAAVQAVQATMQGDFPTARALLVLLAYGIVFALAAIRCFRWE